MKHLLSTLSLLLVLNAGAKNIWDYGVTYQNANTAIGSLMTQQQAQEKFNRAYARLKTRGACYGDVPWTDAQVMQMSNYEMAWWQIVWSTTDVAIGNTCTSRGIVDSRRPFDVTVHAPLPACAGQYLGGGTFTNYIEGDENATTIRVDRSKWLCLPKRYNAIESTSWGLLGNSSYTESFVIAGFRIIGSSMGGYDPSYEGNGIAVWNTGETSVIDQIYVQDCNDAGIRVAAATPLRIGSVSCFNNDRWGILFQGNWGGTILVDLVSGDDNAALTGTEPGDNGAGPKGEGGGLLFISVMKDEGGITSESRGMWMGQVAGYYRGQFAVVVGAVNFSNNNVRPHAMFVVDGRIQNGSMQHSMLTVLACKGYNYDATVHDLGNGQVFDVQQEGQVLMYGFKWHATAPIRFSEDHGIPFTTTPTSCPERLGWFRDQTSVFDLQRCLPVLNLSGGTAPNPPMPCTGWASGSWSTCEDGNQKRTVTTIPSGCTGTPSVAKPPSEQSCTVVPPTPSTPKYTGGAVSNMSAGMRTAVNVASITKAEYTGIVWKSAGTNSYPYLLGLTINGQEAGVQLLPDGTIVGYNVQVTASPTKLLKAGPPVTLTLTFPAATVQYLGNRTGSNDAFLGSWTGLKLY